MGGGHVESEGGFLAQDLCLCGKVMPTIRKVGGHRPHRQSERDFAWVSRCGGRVVART